MAHENVKNDPATLQSSEDNLGLSEQSSISSHDTKPCRGNLIKKVSPIHKSTDLARQSSSWIINLADLEEINNEQSLQLDNNDGGGATKRSGEQFFVDLSTLPVTETKQEDSRNFKSNSIFSMYIDMSAKIKHPSSNKGKLSSSAPTKKSIPFEFSKSNAIEVEKLCDSSGDESTKIGKKHLNECSIDKKNVTVRESDEAKVYPLQPREMVEKDLVKLSDLDKSYSKSPLHSIFEHRKNELSPSKSIPTKKNVINYLPLSSSHECDTSSATVFVNIDKRSVCSNIKDTDIASKIKEEHVNDHNKGKNFFEHRKNELYLSKSIPTKKKIIKDLNLSSSHECGKSSAMDFENIEKLSYCSDIERTDIAVKRQVHVNDHGKVKNIFEPSRNELCESKSIPKKKNIIKDINLSSSHECTSSKKDFQNIGKLSYFPYNDGTDIAAKMREERANDRDKEKNNFEQGRTKLSMSKSTPTKKNVIKDFNLSSSYECGNCAVTDFENIEKLCDYSDIEVTDIVARTSKEHLHDCDEVNNYMHVQDNLCPRISNPESYVANADNSQQLHYHEIIENDSVKLSDLDKSYAKSQIQSVIEHSRTELRLSKSIPETSWKCQDIMSSFHCENTKSLTRIFPELKDCVNSSVLSKSSTRLPVTNTEEQIKESYLIVDDIEKENLIKSCKSCLGQDLLIMLFDEIATDITIEAAGRRLRAHKCILSSRCAYFARILSGGYVESAGDVIVVPLFSYNVVFYALCHIYSGISIIPGNVSMEELMSLSDTMALDGIKDSIQLHLKMEKFHNFHMPCESCKAAVLQYLPVMFLHNLEYLCRESLEWIRTFFCVVWPTKAFAVLPKDIIDKCFQQQVIHLTMDTFLDLLVKIDITMSYLPSARWSEVVTRMCRRVINAAAHFAASKLKDIFTLVHRFKDLIPQTTLEIISNCLSAAVEIAAVEDVCLTYAFLWDFVQESKCRQDKPDLLQVEPKGCWFLYLTNWCSQCERSLVKRTPITVRTQAFRSLPPELQKRLRELGCILFLGTSRPSKKVETKPKTLPDVRMTKTALQRTQHNIAITESHRQAAAKPLGRSNKFENTKSRYMNPKITKDVKKLSSESSRTASPVQSKNRNSRIKAKQPSILSHQNLKSSVVSVSQESLATGPSQHTGELSTESLSESLKSNKFATYTKYKHAEYDSGNSHGGSLVTRHQPMRSKIPVYQHSRKALKSVTIHKQSLTTVSNNSLIDTKSPIKFVSKDNAVVKTASKGKGNKSENMKGTIAISVMERSGTFVKDKPTFGEKTTKIDVGDTDLATRTLNTRREYK